MQDMDSISNNAHTNVSPRKTATTSTRDHLEEMRISKVLTSTSFFAAGATALKRPYSLALNDPHPDDEGSIRRLRTVVDTDLTAVIPGYPNIVTVYDLVNNAVETWTDKECLGSRRVVRQHEEEKNVTKVINGKEEQVAKKWLYSELSPYEYRTYRQVGKEIASVGAGLRKLGLNVTDKVALYAD